MLRRTLTLLSLLTSLVLVLGPASMANAQTYGGGGGGTTTTTTQPGTTTTTLPEEDFASCIVSVDPDTFAPGATVSVSGEGLQPNHETRISLTNGSSVVLATVTTDANGSFSTNVQIPADTAPGSYTIDTECDAAGNVSSTEVTVAGEAITPPGSGSGGGPGVGAGGLPRTGSEVEPLVVAGAVAVLGGIAIVMVATRRRRTAAIL